MMANRDVSVFAGFRSVKDITFVGSPPLLTLAFVVTRQLVQKRCKMAVPFFTSLNAADASFIPA